MMGFYQPENKSYYTVYLRHVYDIMTQRHDIYRPFSLRLKFQNLNALTIYFFAPIFLVTGGEIDFIGILTSSLKTDSMEMGKFSNFLWKIEKYLGNILLKATVWVFYGTCSILFGIRHF
jgi:hypothetical protein